MQANQQVIGTLEEAIEEIRLVMSVATLKAAVDKLNQEVKQGLRVLTTEQWAVWTNEVLARKRVLESRGWDIPYHAHSLGNTAEEVLKSFYAHPGEMDLTPHGYDVHQGFEFALDSNNKLYKKLGLAMEYLTNREEEKLFSNVMAGAVEFYLRRPMLGIMAPWGLSQKKVLHAATGNPIPAE